MLFKKKKTESLSETKAEAPDSGPADQRKYYRVRRRATESIHATLERGSAPPIRGECIDLSIGGTWVEFDGTRDSKLKKGDICSLVIRADSHPDAVQATCRVVTILPLDSGWTRIGFQFTDRIELYAQLDEFYARHFNRRRHVRFVSAYDVRIPIKLAWRGGSLAGVAHDISEGGLGVVVPLEKGKALTKIFDVDLTFRLPRERTDIVCRASIKSRTNFFNSCLLGIEFSPEGGIQNHLESIRHCLEKRLAAYQAWNTKLGKDTLSKRAS